MTKPANDEIEEKIKEILNLEGQRGYAEGIEHLKESFCDALDYWFKENCIAFPDKTWDMLFNILNGRYKELKQNYVKDEKDLEKEIKQLITSREKRVAESIRNKCVETLERLRNEIPNYSDSPTALKIELNSGLLRCIYELKNGVE